MGLFDKIKDTVKDTATKAKDATADAVSAMKEGKAEMDELKKPLDGAIIRYEFTYRSGLDDIPKAKSGAWGMNIMPDRFAFRITYTTKDWLYDLDIPYDDVTDIRIEKRTVTTAEMFLGGGDSANQEQENMIVIEYNDKNARKATLRIEMLTGVTIFNQAAKCKELMDVLRKENILEKIKKSDASAAVVRAVDPVEQIAKLSKLKDAGVISEDEFNAKKADLLAKL